MRSLSGGKSVLQLLLLFRNDLHLEYHPGDSSLNGVDHLFKHIEAFDLVLYDWVLLTVGTQADTLAEHIHVVEMLHPLVVDYAKHDDLFQLAHYFFAQHLLALLIGLYSNIMESLTQLVAAEVHELLGI